MSKITTGLKLLGGVCLISSAILILSGCSSGTTAATSTPATPGAITTAVTSKPAVVTGTSSISLVPSATSVKPGQNFDLTVRVQSSQATRGMHFDVKWDSSKVLCNSAESGNYYSAFASQNQGDVFLLPAKPVIDNDSGRFPSGSTKMMISLTGARTEGGDFLGPSGTGDVYILHMTAKDGASGEVNFTLADVRLGDNTEAINDLQPKIINAKITITP